MPERADDPPAPSEGLPAGTRRAGDRVAWQATAATSSDALAVLNRDGTFRYVSPMIEAMLGLPAPDLVGRSLLDLVHPEQKLEVETRLIRPGPDVGAAPSLAVRLQQADGGWRPAELTAAGGIGDPSIAGVVVNIRDLTGWQAQTDALRQQRDLFEAVINSAASLVIVTDAVGRIVRYNRACEMLIGVPARNVLGRMMWEVLVDPADEERIKAGFSRLQAADLPTRTTVAWTTPSGEDVVVEWTASGILGPGGGVDFVVVTGMDVTRLRREEEQLRRSEARLRDLAEHTTDLICTIDPLRGNITYASPSWSRLGYDPAALIGRPAEELVHPEDVDGLRTPIERLMRDGGSAGFEARLQSAQGHWAWFETRAQAVLGDHGVVREVQLSSRDVDARRQAEQELVRRALHDPLTGLPNRTLLLDRLTTALRRAAGIGGSVAILFCDLDGFKQVNDNFGHATGDMALTEVAQRLEAACRPLDTVARMGGDEFVVLAEGVEAIDAARRLADRIRLALAEPIVMGEAKVFLAVSVGVATSQGGGQGADELLNEADRAMYADKRARRAAPRQP